MSFLIQIVSLVTSLVFTWFVILMIRRERFLLRDSFLWILLGVSGVLASLFPGWVFALSALLGFEKPVNFLYFVCIVVLLGVGLVLCAVVSRQARQITHLIQELSILKSESKGDLD